MVIFMKIGIIGAFDPEIVKFLELFELEKDITKREDIYIGKYKDKEIIVAKSGIGKVNSAAMTQYLIDNYLVDLIINSGCAGSLSQDVGIFDVVISSYVTYHDFYPNRVMEYSVPDNGRVIASARLRNMAIDASKKALVNYHVGPICSGDCYIDSEEKRDFIRKATNALAVDMESGSIGHIARKNNIPFISIRTISDFSNGEENFEELAAYKSSHIVKDIIDNL